MKKIIISLIIFVFCSLIAGNSMKVLSHASSFEAEKKYVGSKSCQPCHQHVKHNQYKIWKESAHARAFKTLLTDKAKAAALKAGLTGSPEKAKACLKCHATGYNLDAGRLGKRFKMEDGIQCETCHGPGAQYKKLQTMRDHAKAVAAGLTDFSAEGAIEKLCLECHNEQSPTFKGFQFKEQWSEIKHNHPPKK